MDRAAASAPSLTGPQQAALGKLVFAAGSPRSLALLCGPAGVGKTHVLGTLAATGLPSGRPVQVVRWSEAEAGPASAARGGTAGGPGLVVLDDADRAAVTTLADWVERRMAADDPPAVVLAGRGRLVSLVSTDSRLEQSVRLRATLPAFTLAESTRLLAGTIVPRCAPGHADEVVRTIHEIAGGMPGPLTRLAEMAGLLADSRPDRGLVADDIERLHRRLGMNAA